MSIRKLLGTAACMAIIGISAGVSYGQFQRLTAQVGPQTATQSTLISPAFAQSAAIAPAAGKVEFVASSVTAWTPESDSEVNAPELIKPMAADQPEPPLFKFAAHGADVTTRAAPPMVLFAHVVDPVVVENAPVVAVAAGTQKSIIKPVATLTKPAARAIFVAAAPHATVSPGTLRRFRNQTEDKEENVAFDEGDGVLEQSFPPAKALRPRKTPAVAASSRVARRTLQLDKIWISGVYR